MSHSTAVQATSNFYGAHAGMRLVRLALGTAQRLWPRLAVRTAYRLFGTPLPLRKPGQQALPAAGWHAERWPFEDAEITLYTRSDLPAEGLWCCCPMAGAGMRATCCRWPRPWPRAACNPCWWTCPRTAAAGAG